MSRARSRRTDPSIPPRPVNSFLIYRTAKMKELRDSFAVDGEPLSQQEISRRIGALWNAESDSVKQHYNDLAGRKKAEHQAEFPGYKFRPQRKTDRASVKEETEAVQGPGASCGDNKTNKSGNDLPARKKERRASERVKAIETKGTKSTAGRKSGRRTLSQPESPATTSPPAGPSQARYLYVPVPTEAFQQLVNGSRQPCQTVDPLALDSPFPLVYSSLDELKDATLRVMRGARSVGPSYLGLQNPYPQVPLLSASPGYPYMPPAFQ